MGTRDGIHRSTDGGATFGPLVQSTPPGSRARNVYDLEYRPPQGAIPGRLYISHWGRPGVVVSTDLGSTFVDVPLATNPDNNVDRVIVSPSGQFYMALEQGGLHVTVPSEATAGDELEAASDFVLDVLGASARGADGVRVTLQTTRVVRVDLFDVLGRRVQTLANGTLAAGAHTLRLDLRGLASGAYVLRALSLIHI